MRVILFDGVCNLCVGFVQFVIRRDPGERFAFASLQSGVGRRLIRDHEMPGDALTSIILIEDDRYSWKSEAALRILRRLSMPWPLLYPFILVPRFIRDAVYGFIAAHRYQWFGKRDECMIPTPELKRRFLDAA